MLHISFLNVAQPAFNNTLAKIGPGRPLWGAFES